MKKKRVREWEWEWDDKEKDFKETIGKWEREKKKEEKRR
jgi:hypothetical protein